jgi:guanylate kinase
MMRHGQATNNIGEIYLVDPEQKYSLTDIGREKALKTSKSFKEKIDNDEMLCYQTFNVTPEGRDAETWYYGITKTEFERAQVFIMTPGEFACIDAETRKNCFVVYLDIDREIREDRILGRNDKNDSVQRRLDADEEDFKGFGDYDLRVTDPDFTAEDVYDLMD